MKEELVTNEIKEVKVLEQNKIEKTPFKAIKTNEDEHYYIVCGKTRILTEYTTYEEVKKAFEKPTFYNISFLVEAIVNIMKGE